MSYLNQGSCDGPYLLTRERNTPIKYRDTWGICIRMMNAMEEMKMEMQWGPVWLEEWSSVAVCVKPDVFEEPVNEVRVQI